MNLSELYLDPQFPGSFRGPDRFYREVSKLYPEITRKQIQTFLKTQDAYTLHKHIRKPKKYRRTLAFYPRDLWQMDLLDLQKHKRQNKNNRYLLVIIDCFDRFVWVKPLKNKTSKSIVHALSLLLMTERPKLIHTDSGSEFMNKDVKIMLEAFGPKLYASYSKHKASLAERYQRTLRNSLAGLFESNQNKNWIDHIDDIVASYNNTYHQSIQMKPIDVTWRDVSKIRSISLSKDYKVQKPKFKVGDIVRVVAPRKLFQKEMERGWYVQKYRIKEIVSTNPITYSVEDLQGKPLPKKFYTQELQHVK